MHDFDQIVYLDLQKTGSTFVSEFLRSTCRLECLKEIKHGRIYSDYRPSAYYFITIRHPLEQYKSLYKYGLDGKGGLYQRITKNGLGKIYKDGPEGFDQWLEFMLNPENSKFFGESYHQVVNAKPSWKRFFNYTNIIFQNKDYYSGPGLKNLGLLSFRFLMLSMSFPLKRLSSFNQIDLIERISDAQIFNRVIKQENLNQELQRLAVLEKPEFFYQEKVHDFFMKNPIKINTSRQAEIPLVSKELFSKLREKEIILFNYYK